MNESAILKRRTGFVLELTLNRPDVLNSFDRPMAKLLQKHLDDAREDNNVRALLLTGAGRAFCAGQDLAEAMPPDGSTPPPIEDIVAESYNPIIRKLRALEKPVVCAVNGVAAGAGANIALACDFVIASTKASFIQAFCNIGLIPDSGGTYFLPRLVGLARANELAMLGGKLPAEEACRIGLIYSASEPEELVADAGALAERLANMPTKALGLIKRAFNASMNNDLESQLELERKLQAEAGASEDYAEGVNAFQEKRKPLFSGK